MAELIGINEKILDLHYEVLQVDNSVTQIGKMYAYGNTFADECKSIKVAIIKDNLETAARNLRNASKWLNELINTED